MGDRRSDNSRFFHRIRRGGAGAAPWAKGDASGRARLNAVANQLSYRGWMFSIGADSSAFDLKVFHPDPDRERRELRVGASWPVAEDASAEELLEVARLAVEAIQGPGSGSEVRLRPVSSA
jgi:hypothetical protein